MAKVTVSPIEDKQEWQRFLLLHPESNFLQSWQWGDFHERLGKAVLRRGFFVDGRLLGIMLSVVEPARRGRYLTVPGGPIMDWGNKSLIKTFKSEVLAQAHAHNCVFVRVRPQLLSDQFSTKIFSSLGFRPAPTHLHAELTHQIDLSQTEEQLLAKMRKGTKYEVKRGPKLNIEVKSSTDPEAIRQFYNLQVETSKRQKFVPFSYDFLEKQFEAFTPDDQVLLYTAEAKGQTLAQAYIIFQGQEAVYHYGASTEAGRKLPGAYAIQWQAIREAKRRGMSRYNLWGVSPHNQPNHRFAGISIFKRGFSGEDVQYLHAQDLVINRPHYLLNLIIEEVRSLVRRV